MGVAVAQMIGPTFSGCIDGIYGWQANFYLIAGPAFLVLDFFYLSCFGLFLLWSGRDASETGRRAFLKDCALPWTSWVKTILAYCPTLSFGASSFFIFSGAAPYIGATLYNLTPQKLGLLIGAPALRYIFNNYIFGCYSTRFGIEKMVTVGLIISWTIICLALLLILSGFGSVTLLLAIMSVLGVGNSISMPSATAGMNAVRASLVGTASGLVELFMIAIGGWFVDICQPFFGWPNDSVAHGNCHQHIHGSWAGVQFFVL